MRTLQIVAGSLALTFYVLHRLAHRWPHVGWLQFFADAFPTAPVRQRRRTRPADHAAAFSGSARSSPAPSPFVGPAVAAVYERHAQRARRRNNVYTGIQFILMGIVIPPGYVLLEMMMFFSETTPTEWFFVWAASLLCIGLGIVAIVRSGRD